MVQLKKFLLKYHRPLFYITWLLIHLIQAFQTELFDDEAYYWVYSKFPAWGYFDHPPMIAILIKAGYAIFHNELGVRLLSILLTTTSLFIIESLTEKKNPFLFYAICCTLALAQIGGMLAVPDAPLMFFIALYFFVYKRFLNNKTLANSLLLGLIIVLMFYTKYHAVLIVLFTGLSNLKLFKSYHAYVACLFAAVLYTPHLLWQYNNGFPSLQFHLFERSASEYRPWYTIEYILSQVLMAGPFTGWLLLFASLFYKPVSLSERALKFTTVGVLLFFLMSTLRGKTEANWTVPAYVGMIVLSHQYLLKNFKLRKILYYSVPVTLIVVFIGRVIMMADLPPAWWILKDEFHDNRMFAKQIQSRAKNKPVVFLDTYQKPSKYWFYSGDTAFALNTPTYRRNNFNYWPLENSYNGRSAFVFGNYDKKFFTDFFILRNGDRNGGKLIPDYFSFSNIMIDEIETSRIDSNKISVKFRTNSPENYLQYFKQAPYDTASIYLALYKKNQVYKYLPLNMTVKDINMAAQQNIISFDLPFHGALYTCKFAISTCLPGRPSLNSAGFEISIE